MNNIQTVFKRTEKKYLITSNQYQNIINTIVEFTNPDKHKEYTICSLYYDTPCNLLIRRSIDKPVYKEKLRLRCYGIPDEDSPAFAEIKKKYKKVVYKRRAKMSFADAWNFLGGDLTSISDFQNKYCSQKQILNEISWFKNSYDNLEPAMLISYDRTAYFGKENPNLRITFDKNVLWRDTNLSPADGVWGNNLLQNLNLPDVPQAFRHSDDLRIMEIKIPGAMPIWLSRLLAENKIYPTSFSKYGNAYKQNLLKGEISYA